MPGIGAESKIGIAKQSQQGTPVVPDIAFPFVSESFSASEEPFESATIGGSAMLKNVVPGDPEGTGGMVQEFDAETSGVLLDLWNGPNGYTAPNAPWTAGQITAKPTCSAGGTGATIEAGDYIYKVAPIWKHNHLNPSNFLMPQSAASDAVTVAAGEKVTVSFTDPAGLTLTDHTYFGTAIYRSAKNGAASTCRFIGAVIGSGSSFEDTGVNEHADDSREPVPNTSLYLHLLEGDAASLGEDRLEFFTAQISKNVGADEQFVDNKVNTFSLAITDRSAAVMLTVATMGGERKLLEGEFEASAPTPREPIMGKRVALVLDGTKNCDIQSLTINGTNNCSRQSTFCDVSISDGARRITADATLIYKDTDLLEKAINGEDMEMLLFLIGEPIADKAALSAASHGVDAIPFPRYAKFRFPRVKFSAFNNQVTGPDQIIASATVTMQEHLSLNTDMQLTLINTLDDYT